MLDFTRFDSLVSLTSYFTSNEVCKDFLAEQRWGEDVVCPYCGAHHCHKCVDGRFICSDKSCNHKFNSTIGTIFESTRLPLTKWFIAIYLISSHKKGISSHQLGRDISVTQKTAWFMLQKVRHCLGQSDSICLTDEVEMDEAYVGGANKWRHESKKIPHGQGGANKTAIFGLIQRSNGNVVAIKVKDTKKETIYPIVSQFVGGKDTILYTDESRIYDALQKESGFKHLSCNHANGEFVVGNATTNRIECFWSHFKRMINGIYHHVSEEHIQSYVDEECFRWNTRNDSESTRFKAFLGACIGVVRQTDVVAVAA